jgi:SAM-dependent methyltransferase
MAIKNVIEILRALVERPGYREYLRRSIYLRFGYNPEQWGRITYGLEWRKFLDALPLESLKVLEISPGPRPVLDKGRVASYTAVNFPQFDIGKDVLPETFDLIVAEHVFEHLRHPYQAARNVRKMLHEDGIFVIATPFLVRIHREPGDFTRWTPEGLEAFLDDCGFTAKAHGWGNRKAVKANFGRWEEYGWKRDLRNEDAFPIVVWAFARKK